MTARSFTDWLSDELDAKLASLDSDQARKNCLRDNFSKWRKKYARFVKLGEQPFNEPHPEFGDMTAFDFAILLADIVRRRDQLMHLMELTSQQRADILLAEYQAQRREP